MFTYLLNSRVCGWITHGHFARLNGTWLVEVLHYVHRNGRFIRYRTGRPPRLSHSSCALKHWHARSDMIQTQPVALPNQTCVTVTRRDKLRFMWGVHTTSITQSTLIQSHHKAVPARTLPQFVWLIGEGRQHAPQKGDAIYESGNKRVKND